MSVLQYGRTARLRVVPVEGGQGREWTDLRVVFSVEKTRKKRPNKAKVQLWNPSADSVAFLQREGLRLELSAGYEDDPPIVLRGTLDDAALRYDNAINTVMELEARDGGAAFSTAVINETWGPGATRRQVIQRVAQAMGYSYARVPGQLAEATYLQGYTAVGPGRDVLDELLAGEATWSSQDDELVIDTGAGTDQEAVLVSADTGLEGSPEKKRKRGRVIGVRFAMRLNGRVKPSRQVVLRSREFTDAVVVVQKVEHRGDTHGQEWTSVVEGKLR